MENINLKNINGKIHFVGIGGISMSGLAETLHNRGFKISGSDNKETDMTKRLRETGIEVFIGQKPENIQSNVELLVYTAAVKKDNPEMVTAMEKGIKIIDRACLMGLIMKDFEKPICVSGTHGKTTTTSMLSEIYIVAGKNPTINLGGVLPSINSNYRIGGIEYFIAESCEYFDSFLKFFPYYGVILNIEKDHLDYFKDLEHIENSFYKFACNISSNGALFINYNILHIENIIKDLECNVVTFGHKDANWNFENISYDKKGFATFDLINNRKNLGRVSLSVRGEHNVCNALAAIAVAIMDGIDLEVIKEGLANFKGPKRRYEFKGVLNGVTIIDDYAHHPTEIKATLSAAKNSEHEKIYAVYQPHTYTRTIKLFDELKDSFVLADVIVLLDIYSAREVDNGEIHSKDLADAVKNLGKEVYYFSTFKEAEKFLLQKCVHGDLLITMGAGDVNIIGENMLLTDLSQLSTE